MKNQTHTKRRDLLRKAGALGVLGLAGCMSNSNNPGNSNSGGSDKPIEWTLGTGSEGGASYVIGSTIVSTMQQKGLTDTVDLSAVETSGTLASYRKLDVGRVQMSGTNGIFLNQSPNKGTFKKDPMKNFDKIRQLRTYFTAQGFVATKKGSGIKSFSDLKGKTVYISPAGSGGRPLFEYVYDQTVGLDNIEARYDSWSAMPDLLKSGQIDAGSAFLVNGNIAPGHAQQLDSRIDWLPLSFPEELKNKLENYPAASSLTVDASDWAKSYTKNIDTTANPYIYVTRSDYSTDAAYKITKLTFESGSELANKNNLLSIFGNDERSIKLLNPDVPIHEGAYKYFKEKGWMKKYDNLKKPPAVQS